MNERVEKQRKPKGLGEVKGILFRRKHQFVRIFLGFAAFSFW
jgi:hypothetical protein